MKLFQLKHA